MQQNQLQFDQNVSQEVKQQDKNVFIKSEDKRLDNIKDNPG